VILRILDELARLRTLVVALGFAFVAYVLIEGPSPAPAGTTDTATTVFLKAIPLIFLCWTTAFLAVQMVTYRRLDSFEYRDASGTPRMPSSKVAKQGKDLMSLGFRPLGEMETRLPWQAWRRSWVFVDATGYVVGLLGVGVSVPLCTSWSDGSFVMTMASVPARVLRTAKSVMVSVRPGVPLPDKYLRHVAEAQALGAGRPEPLRLSSMADYLASGAAAITPTRDAMRVVWLRPHIVFMYAALFVFLVALVVVS
jgi:hypothetical protein